MKMKLLFVFQLFLIAVIIILIYQNFSRSFNLENLVTTQNELLNKVTKLENKLIGTKKVKEVIDYSKCNASGFPCPIEMENVSDHITDEIIKILKSGNNTIYLRHSKKPDKTEYQSQLDVFSLFDDNINRPLINKNSCLSSVGKEEAFFLGQFFKELSIPISTVYSSPICRCVETAEIVFGKVDEVYPFLKYYSAMDKYNEKKVEENYMRTKELFFKKSSKGNKIIVGHGGVLPEIGIDRHIYESGFVIYNHEFGLVAEIELTNLQYYKFLNY